MASSTSDMQSPNKKGLLGDPNLNSTNQEAHPLQYMAGYQRVGITWIDQPRNVQSVPQKGSGKGGTTTGYKYYADMLALVCLGPIDAITYVIMDNTIVWTGSINRGSEDHITISCGGKGNMVLFWGTPDQQFYPTLQAFGHPAYRNQCVAFFPQLNFGTSTAAPNVELCIKRVLNIPWLPGLPNNSDDANWVAVLADLLTNPLYGDGLDPALIDQPQWLATAQQLAAADLVGSPLITDAIGMRQLITQICEYFYGYLRWTNDNKLQIGLIRDAPTDLTPLVKLTASHLTDLPDIDTSEWSSTFNRTIVTFVEQAHYWQDDYRSWSDSGNFAITGQPLVQTLDRKWITRNTVASSLAQMAGKYYALPIFTGTLKCRRSAVETTAVGDWIVLDYDAAVLQFALVLQVTGYKSSGDSSEVIELEVQGQNITTDPRELYDPQDVINNIPGSQDVRPLALWRVLELPKALSHGRSSTDPLVAALAVRGGFETVTCYVLDSPDNATYDWLGTITDFAFGGQLTQDYPAATDDIDLTIGLLVNLAGPDTTLPDQTEAAMDNGRLLVFVDDEIMAVRQVQVVSATQVQLFVKRGKYDTVAADHPQGSQVFIVAKRDLRRHDQDSFAADDSVYYKLQPCSLGQQYDLSLVEPEQLTIIGRAQMPQPFTGLTVDGAATDPASFATGTDVAFAWTLTTNELYGNVTPDQDYFATSSIFSVLVVYDSESSLQSKHHFLLDPGVDSLTYANADMVSDFGGSEPASFYVRLWSKKNGQRSFSFVDCTVNRT